MTVFMNICYYALIGIFAQNLVFTSGVGAERALRELRRGIAQHRRESLQEGAAPRGARLV